MFDKDDEVHVVYFIVMAAFNVLEETLHIFAGLDWKNTTKDMTKRTQVEPRKKLQNAIAIFMDERSMLSELILGVNE
jgi:hypothetical protein